MKERNISVDILKFMAVLLITHSHMGLLYGKYHELATGGTLGDVLFFFCSGFTLFLKPMNGIKEFPNWYKRRINRIYPTIFAVAIYLCTFFNSKSSFNDILLYGGGWFVTCIMIYYVVIYFIGSYWKKGIYWIMGAVAVLSCIWFYCSERPFPWNMYGIEGGYLKWLLYFIFMLLGAKLGEKQEKSIGKSALHMLAAVCGIIGFYAFYIIGRKNENLEWIQVYNFIPLIFAIYYLYRWGNSPIAHKIYNNKVARFIIRFVGGLCLEIYLVQGSLFTNKLNNLFPLNLIIVFCEIVVVAYLVRCLARFISQTFKDEPYNWGKIVAAY